MLLPQEIAEKMSPEEYEILNEKVFSKYKQGFSVVSIDRKASKCIVVVQLDNRTHEEIVL